MGWGRGLWGGVAILFGIGHLQVFLGVPFKTDYFWGSIKIFGSFFFGGGGGGGVGGGGGGEGWRGGTVKIGVRTF